MKINFHIDQQGEHHAQGLSSGAIARNWEILAWGMLASAIMKFKEAGPGIERRMGGSISSGVPVPLQILQFASTGISIFWNIEMYQGQILLDAPAVLHLYRILQEAVANIHEV